jgi:hypothetical protein
MNVGDVIKCFTLGVVWCIIIIFLNEVSKNNWRLQKWCYRMDLIVGLL